MANRVRIVDIAEELGVSTATVSNVIHGKTKKISEETVRRVQALLEERHYIPSMAGILLARNNSRIIGVVVNNHEKYEGKVLEDAFVSSALNALVFELEKAGYFMMIKATQDWSEIERFASMWNMDGMVLMGFCEADYEKLRARMHIPFVVYDGFFKACRTICNLIADNYEGGRMVGDYLRRMGHRRAMLVSDNDESVDRERMAGFREGFSDGQADFMKVPMNRAGRKLYYTQNMERIRSYTAAFAVSDVYAAEFMHFLLERGISVPGEISVVGFDDNALCENCFPRLTTVGQDAENRARMAMQALKRLWDESDGPTVEVLPVKLVIRDSVRRLW